MKVRVYHTWQDLEPLRAEWNSLVARSFTNEIFLTFDFLKTWQTSATRPATPYVIVVQNGGALTGIAPLMIANRQVLGTHLVTAEFLGTPYIDYADFIYADSSALPALWQGVADLKRQVDAAYLQQIPESSPTVSFLEAEAHLAKRKSANCLAATLPTGRGLPLKAFLRKPDQARNLRRYIRLLEAKGTLSLEVYLSQGNIAAALEILIQQHRTHWNASDTPSCFNRPAFVDLYRNLAATLALSGNMLVAILRLDGVPLACHWGYLYANKYLLHTTSMNLDYRNCGCGLVLILKLEQYLNDSQPGVRRLDFARGSEHYKTCFADLHSTNIEFIVTTAARAAALRIFLWGSDLARRNDLVMGTLRKYRELLSDV